MDDAPGLRQLWWNMKNKRIAFFVLIGVLGVVFFKVLDTSTLKELFIQSRLADLYINYVRDEKPFDSDHVITHLENGMPIIVNKYDRCVCWFVRLLGRWDSNEKRVLEKIIHKGLNIVEVGANFGVYTLQMADLVGKSGKVYAFEANPMVSKYLKESIKLNNLQDIIVMFEKAAGDIPGEAFLEFGVENIGGGHLVSSASSSSIKTHIVRLDDVVNEEHIDLLKIDAEGCEFKILQGAKELIKRNADHIILMMEFIPSHLKNQKSDPEALLQFLKEQGFFLWRVGKKRLHEDILVPVSYDALAKLSDADIVASKKPLL
jgi:FkbM family methyltransferase